MPQIELVRPLELSPSGGSELTIENRGSNTVFYGQSPTVSSSNKTGSILVGETLTLSSGYVWVVAEKTPVILDLREKAVAAGGGGEPTGPAGGDLTGTYPNPTIGSEKVTTAGLKAKAVTTAKIETANITEALLGPESVAAAKIKSEAVTNEKVKSGTLEKNRLTALAITELEAAGGPPSGAAGGDLTGTYPNPTLGSEKVLTAAIKKENVTKEKLSAGVQAELEAVAGGTPGVVSILTYAGENNGNTKLLADCNMTAASKTLKCPSKPFVEGDAIAKKPISVAEAGVAKAVLKTTIATFVSTEEVTLTAAATETVAEVGGRYGTDDSAIFAEAIKALNEKGGGTLLITALNKKNEEARWSFTNVRLNATAKALAKNLTIMAYGAHFTNILGEGKPFWHTGPTEEAGVYLAENIRFYGGIYEGTGYEAKQEHVFRIDKAKDITFRDVYAKNWAGVSGNASVVYCADARRVKVESCTILECANYKGGAQNALQVDWSDATGSTAVPFTELIVTNCIATSGQCPLNVNIGTENKYNNTAPLRLIVTNNYLEAFGTNSWNAFSLEIGGKPPARSQYEQVVFANNIAVCKGTKESGNSTGIQFVNSSEDKILEPEQFADMVVSGNVIEATRTGIYSNGCRTNISGNVIKAVAAAVLCENTGSGSYTFPLTGVRVANNIIKMGISTFPETASIVMTKCVRAEILDNMIEWENGEPKTVAETCVNSGSKLARTVTTKPFVQGDVGKTIAIPEAGVAKATLTTKIIAVLGSDEIEIETAATETVGKTISDAKITTGTKVLTSASKPFAAGDKGKTISVQFAAKGEQHMVTEIEAVTSETEVKTLAAAGATANGSLAFWGGVTSTYESLPTNKHKGIFLKSSENCKVRSMISYCPSEAIFIEAGGAHKILPGTNILNAFSKPGATGPAIKTAGTLNGHIYVEGVFVQDVKGTSAMTFGLELTGVPGGFKTYSESNTYLGWKTNAWKNATTGPVTTALLSIGDVVNEEPPQEYTTFTGEPPKDAAQKYNAGDKAWNGVIAEKEGISLWVCSKSGVAGAAEWSKIKGT